MTEAEWLACADPTPMLEFLRGKASDRKLRLFACACVRRIWRLLCAGECRNAVEGTELYADGRLSEGEFFSVFRSAADALDGISGRSAIYAASAAGFCARWVFADENHTQWEPGEALSDAQFAAKQAARAFHPSTDKQRSAQATLVLDVFGNPFRPSPPFPPAVLAWNDRTVPRIAQCVYDDRKMPEGWLDTARLDVLADALLDAGCEDEALIQHCREQGPHVRGCWAVDAILGKE